MKKRQYVLVFTLVELLIVIAFVVSEFLSMTMMQAIMNVA